MIAVAHRWSEVHDQHRFAIYSLVEAHGCHCEGTGDGLLSVTMKPSDDGKGWSCEARDLHVLLQRLGFVEHQPRYEWPCDRRDEWTNARGYWFVVAYYPPAKPLRYTA